MLVFNEPAARLDDDLVSILSRVDSKADSRNVVRYVNVVFHI